jgi:transcriptional regulator with PAS, ATPase and Fis domain
MIFLFGNFGLEKFDKIFMLKYKKPMEKLGLELIRDFLQDFAESLAQALDLEITIADRNFVRIVGTGAFKDKVFQPLPVGSVYRNSVIFCKPFLVEEAVASEYCQRCEFRTKCVVRAEACAPICLGDKVLGVIGIVATDNSQKRRFLRKRVDYCNTIRRLAELITVIFEVQETGSVTRYPGIRFFSGIVTFDMILGKSKKMCEAIDMAKKAAQTDANILITGESGTGKELFSRAIHYGSPRKDHVFEAINCSAIPDTLLESELFGYEQGAFTGAIRGGKIGRFQFAHQGTILLDEIGDMSPNLQAKLLRFLEDKYIHRLGGIGPVQINTRIVAATNKNLKSFVKQGRFREDLYYRLDVIPIFIPPLRERGDDIDLLAKFLLQQYNMQYKKKITSIEEKLLVRFHEYDWPGNVRELKNLIEYGVFLENTSFLREKTVISKFESNGDICSRYTIATTGILSSMVRNIERKIIEETLDRYKGTPFCMDKTARSLGISRASLYRKLNSSNNRDSSQ